MMGVGVLRVMSLALRSIIVDNFDLFLDFVMFIKDKA